jgi:hypothetical protein
VPQNTPPADPVEDPKKPSDMEPSFELPISIPPRGRSQMGSCWDGALDTKAIVEGLARLRRVMRELAPSNVKSLADAARYFRRLTH